MQNSDLERILEKNLFNYRLRCVQLDPANRRHIFRPVFGWSSISMVLYTILLLGSETRLYSAGNVVIFGLKAMGNTLEGTSASVEIVIIGGGPTGLGAAYRLHQRGFQNWLLLDAEKHPGGLAGSVKTLEGFRFDHGFKTLTNRFEYFNRLLNDFCNKDNGRDLKQLQRDNFVFIGGKLIRYPIQNNLGSLPPAERDACLIDILKTKLVSLDSKQRGKPLNLDEHLVLEWGEKLCNIFFRPYIYKLLAFPTGKLTFNWTSSKIPPFRDGKDIDQILHGEEPKDSGCGKDFETVYPAKGGLAGFWRDITKILPKNNVRFKSEVSQLNVEEKKVTTKEGLEIKFDHMISSMALPTLLRHCERDDLEQSLIYSSLFVVCVGVRGAARHSDITGCIYFPESDTIFHRASIFSNRDLDSVPTDDVTLPTLRLVGSESSVIDGESKVGPYWSLLFEVSGGPLKTIDERTVVDQVIKDACVVDLLREGDEIVSLHLTEMTHGYPLPTILSESKVDQALSWLKTKNIWSRGRFGAFKYDLGDIESSFIQGVEAVDNIFDETPETCLFKIDDSSSSSSRLLPCYDVTPTDPSVTSSTISVSSELVTDTEGSLNTDQTSDTSVAEGEAKG